MTTANLKRADGTVVDTATATSDGKLLLDINPQAGITTIELDGPAEVTLTTNTAATDLAGATTPDSLPFFLSIKGGVGSHWRVKFTLAEGEVMQCLVMDQQSTDPSTSLSAYRLVVRNSTGAIVATGDAPSGAVTLTALVQNLPAGTYYADVYQAIDTSALVDPKLVIAPA